jgi:hypothetical protein
MKALSPNGPNFYRHCCTPCGRNGAPRSAAQLDRGVYAHVGEANKRARFGLRGTTMEGSSFSGLLTRVEIAHIRIGSAGNGRI